jgi:hypothetical protein
MRVPPTPQVVNVSGVIVTVLPCLWLFPQRPDLVAQLLDVSDGSRLPCREVSPLHCALVRRSRKVIAAVENNEAPTLPQ